MNNREKEVLEYTLEQEKAVIAELKDIYSQALDDIGEKINTLMADELTQSKIYQIEYQKALKGQVSAILDNLNSEQYNSISDYLRGCYEDGFIGTLYSLQGSGIPLIIPIDQEQVVDALLLDSKISEGLYTKLGNNVSQLKKSISQEISRGISTAMPYADIARNLQSKGNMTINQSMNIVQTEGHRIQNRSALDSGEKAKAKGADLVKVWDSTLDSKTRPHHRALDGQVRELDEDFEVDGLTADSPGHFGTPSEDCRCRCVVLIKPRWDVDGSFTKRNNETGELLEFADVKSYEEFKNKYWQAVDKSGGSGIDYMSKSFRPKYSGNIHNLNVGNIYIETKSVKNSKFNLIADANETQRSKAVRLAEKNLAKVQKLLPNDFEIPTTAVVDFKKHGFNINAIAGYDKNSGIMYINSKYDTTEKILGYVNKIKGQFANNTELAPILHELGHKYYEDSVKTLAKSKNIEYNKAKDIIDEKIYNYVHERNSDKKFLLKNLSEYAQRGFDKHSYTEIIAESFSVSSENGIASALLKLLGDDLI